MKSFLKVTKGIFTWLGFLFLWFIYAFATLDRSEKAIEHGFGNPIPGGFSFIVLAVVVAFLLRRAIFNKNLKSWNLVSKIVFIALLLLGLVMHWPQITGEY